MKAHNFNHPIVWLAGLSQILLIGVVISMEGRLTSIEKEAPASTLSAEEQTLAEMKEEPYKPRERITSDGIYDFRVAAINHRWDGFTSILFELEGHPEVPRVGNGAIWFKTSRKCADLKVGQVYKMRYVTANSGTFPAFRSKVFGEKVVCL